MNRTVYLYFSSIYNDPYSPPIPGSRRDRYGSDDSLARHVYYIAAHVAAQAQAAHLNNELMRASGLNQMNYFIQMHNTAQNV